MGSMDKEISIWYDEEGDFLEVSFEKREGYFKEAENDAENSIKLKYDTTRHLPNSRNLLSLRRHH